MLQLRAFVGGNPAENYVLVSDNIIPAVFFFSHFQVSYVFLSNLWTILQVLMFLFLQPPWEISPNM